MILSESEKHIHKKKAVDALDRMKNAVDKGSAEDIDRAHRVADHHIDEVEKIISEENEKEKD